MAINEIQKSCAICGKLFTLKTVNSLYCSKKCGETAYRRKKAEQKKAEQFTTIADNVPSDRPFISIPEAIAIYISPISRDAVNSLYHTLCFQIKELLLEKIITSQVIYKDRPNNLYFIFHLPNIAIAFLAKIGGISWQLNSRSANKDLVVGVSAFLSEKVGERYVGSAFSFYPNGLFKNLDCCKANDLESIVAGIRKAIGLFIVDSETYPSGLSYITTRQ